MTKAEPRVTPLAEAAGSPIGANRVSDVTKIRDVLIVVIIPFAVPAAVLPIADGLSSLTLTNLAFAFVAVAMAGVARAVTAKTDEWQLFVLFAFLLVCIQTGLAASGDASHTSDMLKRTVLNDTVHVGPTSIPAMRSAALAVVDAQPGIVRWVISVVSGVALMALSLVLIRREK